MPEYHFAIARSHERAFAHARAILRDDDAAISYARSLGITHPEAAAVTVACGGRVIARTSVDPARGANGASRQVRESEALVARARLLLEATAPIVADGRGAGRADT